VLFIHGDDDRNVPFQQTTDLVEKLRAKARTGACRAALTARGFISSGFLAQLATEASRGRDSGSISISAGATVSHRELKLS
jgi:hypothetical protein